MTYSEKKNNNKKYSSIAITLIVIFMLILSGPAGAVSVSIAGLSGTQTTYGIPVSFTVDITIDDPDTYVPISNFSLDITGPITAEYGFSLDGSAIVSNDNITVTPISVPTTAYGNGTGYGVDNGYGYGFGYGYGYGYNSGAGGGSITYSYEVTFTNFPSGDYTVIANLNTGNFPHSAFSSSPASFEILPVSITTGTLIGIVKNPSGTPVSGATISVDDTTRNVTDSNGYYEITSLAIGSHTVAASKVNYSENSTTVSITGINSHNFTLTPTKATITGTVVDDENNAIANANIVINTTPQTSVYTNAYGKYIARVLVENISVFNVTASAPDHETIINTTSVTIAQIKSGVDFTLNRSKVDLELASGEYAVKFAENTTNATFALNIRNYGSTALFAVTNSSTSATVVISETAPIIIGSNVTTISVNISSTNVDAYPVTITVTNSTQNKIATIDLVAIMKNSAVAYNDTSSTVDSDNVGNGTVVVGNSIIESNATVTNASVFSNSTVSGEESSVVDSVVRDNSTVTNATVTENSIVSSSNVTAGATVTAGSVVEGSNVTGATIITNTTLNNVNVIGSTVTGVTLSNVTLEGATVVASGGEAMITGGKINISGVVFENVYEDTLVDELVIAQSLGNSVNNTSPIVDTRDSTGTYLNLTATGAGNLSVSQCSISPGGAFGLTDNEETIGDFFQFSFTGNMTDAWIRIYIDQATKEEYDAADKTLSVSYHNATTGLLEPHTTSDSTWDTEIGQWYVEFYTTHFSTFTLIGTTTPDTPPDTPSSGGGSYHPTTTVKETKTVPSIVAGGNASVSFTKTDVTGIEITVKNAVSNVIVTVEKLLTRPSSIPDVLDQIFSAGSNLKTFGYLSMSVNIDDSNIDNAKVTFKVDKSWLTENKVDKSSVKLARHHDGWDSLPTEISSEDGDYVYYVATTPGFSTFAIIGEEIIAATDTVTPPKETISDDESTLTDVADEEEPESKSSVTLIVIVLLLAIIAGVAYYKRDEINKLLKK